MTLKELKLSLSLLNDSFDNCRVVVFDHNTGERVNIFCVGNYFDSMGKLTVTLDIPVNKQRHE